jgi:hypothetical protein
VVPVPSDNVELGYYAKTELDTSSDASTNWLLTNFPDVYLFGTLAVSGLYTSNDDRTAVWGTRYEQGLEGIRLSDRRGRYARGGITLSGVVV